MRQQSAIVLFRKNRLFRKDSSSTKTMRRITLKLDRCFIKAKNISSLISLGRERRTFPKPYPGVLSGFTTVIQFDGEKFLLPIACWLEPFD